MGEKITDVCPHEIREIQVLIDEKFDLIINYHVNGFFACQIIKRIDVLSWLANHKGVRVELPCDKDIEDKLKF